MAAQNTLESKRMRRAIRTYRKNLAAKRIPFGGVLAPGEPANPAPNVKWLGLAPLVQILSLFAMQQQPRKQFTLTRRRDSRTGRMSIYA